MRHPGYRSFPSLPDRLDDQMPGRWAVVGSDPITGTNHQVLLLGRDISSPGLPHQQLRKFPAQETRAMSFSFSLFIEINKVVTETKVHLLERLF